MSLREMNIQKYLRISSVLVIAGLVIEIISLVWQHPLAFVLFAFVGAGLIGLGILVYLAGLVFARAVPRD